MRRGSDRGLPSRTASGSRAGGKFWWQTGRWNRRIARVPTDVERGSDVAGNGPPCTMAWLTSTPVGHLIDRIIEVWDVTTAEDRAIVDNNQAGVSSLRYTGVPYQPKEQPTLDMVRWYLAQPEGTLAVHSQDVVPA